MTRSLATRRRDIELLTVLPIHVFESRPGQRLSVSARLILHSTPRSLHYNTDETRGERTEG